MKDQSSFTLNAEHCNHGPSLKFLYSLWRGSRAPGDVRAFTDMRLAPPTYFQRATIGIGDHCAHSCFNWFAPYSCVQWRVQFCKIYVGSFWLPCFMLMVLYILCSLVFRQQSLLAFSAVSQTSWYIVSYFPSFSQCRDGVFF